MERKVGEVFKYKNVTLQVIKEAGCKKCFFKGMKRSDCHSKEKHSLTGYCSFRERKDSADVQFIKIDNMEEETRNLQVTLSMAKEWFDGKDKNLKRLAIIAFPDLYHDSTKTWEDILKNKALIPDEACYIDACGEINLFGGSFLRNERDKNTCSSERVAKMEIAISKISLLMPYYGGMITDEEWNIPYCSYSITCGYKEMNIVRSSCREYLAFHEEHQAEEFIDNNKRLLKDYFMLD